MNDQFHKLQTQMMEQTDQERRWREAKGIYQTPNSTLRLGIGFLILLGIVILGIVIFHFF